MAQITHGIFNLSLLLSTNVKYRYYLVIMNDWQKELKKLIQTQVCVRNRTSNYICSDCKTVEEILHYNQIPKLTGFVEDRKMVQGRLTGLVLTVLEESHTINETKLKSKRASKLTAGFCFESKYQKHISICPVLERKLDPMFHSL